MVEEEEETPVDLQFHKVLTFKSHDIKLAAAAAVPTGRERTFPKRRMQLPISLLIGLQSRRPRRVLHCAPSFRL